MRNKIRGILLFILAATCMLIGMTVSAEKVIINEDGIENIVSTDENSSQAMVELKLIYPNEPDISLFGQYLSYGTAMLKKLGSGQVNFYGDTIAIEKAM